MAKLSRVESRKSLLLRHRPGRTWEAHVAPGGLLGHLELRGELAGGHSSPGLQQQERGHSAGWFFFRSIAWSLVTMAVFITLSARRFARL